MIDEKRDKTAVIVIAIIFAITILAAEFTDFISMHRLNEQAEKLLETPVCRDEFGRPC